MHVETTITIERPIEEVFVAEDGLRSIFHPQIFTHTHCYFTAPRGSKFREPIFHTQVHEGCLRFFGRPWEHKGLRAAMRLRRNLCLRRDESVDGEAVGSCLGISDSLSGSPLRPVGQQHSQQHRAKASSEGDREAFRQENRCQ